MFETFTRGRATKVRSKRDDDDDDDEVGGNTFFLACFDGNVTDLCAVGFLFCIGKRVEEDGFASCFFGRSSTTTSLSSSRV